MFCVQFWRWFASDCRIDAQSDQNKAGSVGDLSDRFLADRSGSFIIPTAFALTVGLVALGGAIDFGRWINARTDLRSAVDSAVLAAARELQTNGGDTTKAVEAAKSYLAENTKTITPLNPQTGDVTDMTQLITFSVENGGTEISATGAVDIESVFFLDQIDPVFQAILGEEAAQSAQKIARLPIFRGSGADESRTKLRVGEDAERDIEIAVMLDVTGSMNTATEGGSTRLDDMKAAAKSLIDIVVWEDQSQYRSRVALIPFAEAVNVGNMNVLKSGNSQPSSKKIQMNDSQQRTVYRAGNCAVERVNKHKFKDTSPTSNSTKFPRLYNVWDSCSPSAEIIPLTSDKELLKNHIDSFQGSGSTAGHLGTAWAWYMLSPNFANVVPTDSQPDPYPPAPQPDTNPTLQKFAVLMTDGEYNLQYCKNKKTAKYMGVRDKNSNGSSWYKGKCTAPNGSSSSQARQICEKMKENNIEVYTVGFGLDENGTAAETMRLCASSEDHAYAAENGEELQQAFNDIALQIAELYLSK